MEVKVVVASVMKTSGSNDSRDDLLGFLGLSLEFLHDQFFHFMFLLIWYGHFKIFNSQIVRFNDAWCVHSLDTIWAIHIKSWIKIVDGYKPQGPKR